ncbi:MAG: membrane protein insertase YidC, partial [Sulfurimicrobium sp.]|nr:membrane protein insertase YidC [Sulfurimicrobium sp.]
MDTQRLIMFVVFSFSILMLWDAWQKDQHPQPTQNMPATVASSTSGVPVPSKSAPTLPHAVVPDDVQQLPKGERIKVHTDTLYVEIDTVGGDIRRLELTKHRDDTDKSKHFVLFAEQKPNTYRAQSGLIGNILPTHKTLFTVHGKEFSLATGASDLKVKLSAPISSGIQVDKIFTFHRDSYVVDVEYQIRNGSENAISPHAYYQLVRDDSASKGDSMFISTYAGPAIYTENQKFQKVSFSDIEKNKTTHQKQSNDGWVAMLQHYFLSAWLPNNGMSREFYTKAMGNKLYAAGVILPVGSIAPGASGMISVPLYAGPQEQENLSKLAPGLDLTIDYGLLTIIAAPLFWVLSKIQGMVNNWGVAIILLTVLIKLAFYPLAAKSYRSMAHMRVLGPKLQKLKEQYGDDRQRLHQAMMELYKTEKVNPLGGCL